MHWMLDGRRTGSTWTHVAWRGPGVEGFCRRAISMAEMTLILGPDSEERLDGSVYGFAVLAESHVSVELKRATGRAWIDVFSCNDFDAEKMEEMTTVYFALTSWKARVVERDLAPAPVAPPGR